jgi:hypothetical protein
VEVFCENVFVVEGFLEGFLGLGRNTEALSAAAKARFVVCAAGAAAHNISCTVRFASGFFYA